MAYCNNNTHILKYFVNKNYTVNQNSKTVDLIRTEHPNDPEKKEFIPNNKSL